MMRGIFDYFKDIKYTNQKEFLKRVDEERKNLFEADRKLIKSSNIKKVDIEKIDIVENGRYNIEIDNILFECFYYSKEKSNKMYVILNGGGMTPHTPRPVFKRWSFYSVLDGIFLNIADPMYEEYDGDMYVAWYYGKKQQPYLDYVVEIVKKIAVQKAIKRENIIFYGSSGGGYAALYCSCKLQGTKAIAINPQIKLKLFSRHTDLERHLKIDLDEKDKYGRNDIAELISNNKNSKLILAVNSRSKEDILQLEYLCMILNKEFKYGLQQIHDNMLCWVFDAELKPFHAAQETKDIVFALKYLTEIDFNNVEEYQELYGYFNELWHGEFEQKKQFAEYKRCVNVIKSTQNNLLSELKIKYIKIFENKYIRLDESGDKYYSVPIYHKLKENTEYLLKIGNATMISGGGVSCGHKKQYSM